MVKRHIYSLESNSPLLRHKEAKAKKKDVTNVRTALLTFITAGIKQANEKGFLADKGKEQREAWLRACWRSDRVAMLQSMMPRTTYLDTRAVCGRKEWEGPLEEVFVKIAEHIYLRLALASAVSKGGKGTPLGQWKKEVVKFASECWPRWELPLEEVPLVV